MDLPTGWVPRSHLESPRANSSTAIGLEPLNRRHRPASSPRASGKGKPGASREFYDPHVDECCVLLEIRVILKPRDDSDVRIHIGGRITPLTS